MGRWRVGVPGLGRAVPGCSARAYLSQGLQARGLLFLGLLTGLLIGLASCSPPPPPPTGPQ